MKTKEKSGFISLIINIINFILKWLSRSDEKKKQEEIDKAKTELQKALAEGRITDAAYWKKKLEILTKVAAILIAMLVLSGCLLTTKPTEQIPPVVIIGERINKVSPGDHIIVPKLTPPAKQWYLIDDHGLYQWLDIDLSKK